VPVRHGRRFVHATDRRHNARKDGALFNDLYDAMFLGDTADWGNAATLFGDLFSL
jgi:hypothetical protein